MATQVQRRRGTASEHNTFTGAAGEVTVNTTNDSLHVHDGATAGGIELSRADGQNANMPTAAMPAGSVIQVVQTKKLDTFSTTSTADITGLSVSITPSSSSNNIVVFVSLNYSGQDDSYFGINLKRNGTRLSVPVAPGNRYGALLALAIDAGGNNDLKLGSATLQYLDSPSTSLSITYQLEIFEPYVGRAVTINRSNGDADASYIFRGTSYITAMEIAG